MNNNMSNHSSSAPCLSSQEMLDYTKGILSPIEQHRIEKHLLECEFCADAMEGVEMMTNPKELLNVEEELNFDMDAMISGEEEEQDDKIKVLFPWRIAAAFALILVSTFTLWMIIPKTNVQELALENSQPYPAPEEAASETILQNREMQVPNEQSAPTVAKNNAKTEAPAIMQMETTVSETVTAEKDVQADEVFSSQLATEPQSVNEGNEKALDNTLAKAQKEERDDELKTKSMTMSEVAVASKKQSARAASSVEAQEEAATMRDNYDSYKVNTDELYKRGIKEYKNKKYALAISHFEKCSDKAKARFYEGVSYFLIENPHLALTNLEKYIQTNQPQYREASYWYSGLSYLKLGNKVAAKQAFEKVLPFKGEFEKQATEMLKSL
jgi:tetratricopeptide (TPR) repeat protein